jgi:hypothetical protein
VEAAKKDEGVSKEGVAGKKRKADEVIKHLLKGTLLWNCELRSSPHKMLSLTILLKLVIVCLIDKKALLTQPIALLLSAICLVQALTLRSFAKRKSSTSPSYYP